MVHSFPIPPGADKKSILAIEHYRVKLGNLTIGPGVIQFVLKGIMEAQKPRDLERAQKEAQKKQEAQERRERIHSYRHQSLSH